MLGNTLRRINVLGPKFQQVAIVTNKFFMVEGRELTYSNCIKIWDKIAI